MPTWEGKIPAASVAADLVRRLVAQKKMDREDAYLLSNWIDREIKLGHIPDDADLLGLVESGEWRSSASDDGRPRRLGRTLGIGKLGVTSEVARSKRGRKRAKSEGWS